jgi:NAD-dependent dihydropyrimidine dehydrogenase PreA subunit
MVAVIFIEKCNGCSWCLDVCPHQIIILNNENKAEIIEDERCIECGACALQCPQDAILAHPHGCGCVSSVVKKKIRKIFHLPDKSSQCC